jgi:hypothetical protein
MNTIKKTLYKFRMFWKCPVAAVGLWFGWIILKDLRGIRFRKWITVDVKSGRPVGCDVFFTNLRFSPSASKAHSIYRRLDCGSWQSKMADGEYFTMAGVPEFK